MTMLLLKRLNVPLDRDVIFLAESGEEGSSGVGIQYMVGQHFPAIDAEYCLAEGGNVTRVGGAVKYSSIQTLEKIPRAIELTAHGISGHASVPLQSNALRPPVGGGARDRTLAATDAPERDHPSLFRAHGQHLVAGTGHALSRHT